METLYGYFILPHWVNLSTGGVISCVDNKKKLSGFSLQANYTDRAIAAGQRS
jgi:hypothetical protein